MNKINRRSVIPLYYQLSSILRDQITFGLNSGDLISGDKIESERELMLKYNLSRNTVRKAIDELVKDDVIFKEHGQGNFIVSANLVIQSRIDTFCEHNKLLKKAGYQPKCVLIESDEIDPDLIVRNKLELEPGEKVKYIKKVFYADQKPAILSIDYIPILNNESSLLGIEHQGHNFFDFLEKQGRQPIEFILADIFPVMADRDLMPLLSCNENTPLLLLHELMLDPSQKKPILFAKNYYLSEFIHFSLLRRRSD